MIHSTKTLKNKIFKVFNMFTFRYGNRYQTKVQSKGLDKIIYGYNFFLTL